ncbi:MAG: acyloxyacyl hydrolase [Candidatus Omnitrophota bacterium]
MKRIVALTLSLLFLTISPAFSDEEKPKSLEAVEFFTGFSRGKLKDKQKYDLLPFLVDFDFGLNNFLSEKLSLNVPVLVQFQVEPFISYVYSPDTNMEIGNVFLLKIGLLPRTWKFQPYIQGGAGLIYITQQTREQATQFNFSDQAGAGIHYFFSKSTALSFQYRFRHISNSDIELPNKGINSNLWLIGVTFKL